MNNLDMLKNVKSEGKEKERKKEKEKKKQV